MNILIADSKYNLKHHLSTEISGLRILAVSHNKITSLQIKKIDLAIINADMIDQNNKYIGLDLIKKIKNEKPYIPIVSLTRSMCPFKMEQSLNYGASKVLIMPKNYKSLLEIIKKEKCFKKLLETIKMSKKISWASFGPSGFNILRQISQLKHEHGPILIEGETGTGKEVVTDLICSIEPNKHVVKVNIAALNPNLFESEFFGHTKGSFTGAEKETKGFAEQAHGGILFLDEIEALPLNLQVKLLRFLESGEIQKVGCHQTRHTNCKVILATNTKLEKLVKKGQFREDLLWRVSGKKICLPPLSQRLDEIKDIFEFYLQKLSKRVLCLSDCGLSLINSYSWPGNIRELIRVCEKVVLEAPLPIIRRKDLLPHLINKTGNLLENTSSSYNQLLKKYECDLIKNYYFQYNKNIEKTCKALKVSRSNLYKKLKEYQIN